MQLTLFDNEMDNINQSSFGKTCQGGGRRWGNVGCVYGPQRAIAWRILDAQYFGVAQRRRRVFVVASARDGFDPAKILFEFDGLRRDIAPSREAEQEAATDVREGFTGSSFGQYREGVGTLRAAGGDLGGGSETLVAGFRKLTFESYEQDETASTMMARYFKSHTDLVVTAKGCTPTKLHDYVNAITASYGQGGVDLETKPLVLHGTQDPCVSEELAFSLGRNGGQENAVYGIPGNWIGRNPEHGGNAVQPMNNISPCLNATDKHGVADTRVVLPINTMTVQGRPSDDKNPRMGIGIGLPEDPQNTLSRAHCHGVFDSSSMSIRRLTPIECERLQGFPDNHTRIPWRNKPAEECPDGQRYKALGNSMAVPVMRWIGERIQDYLKCFDV